MLQMCGCWRDAERPLCSRDEVAQPAPCAAQAYSGSPPQLATISAPPSYTLRPHRARWAATRLGGVTWSTALDGGVNAAEVGHAREAFDAAVVRTARAARPAWFV